MYTLLYDWIVAQSYDKIDRRLKVYLAGPMRGYPQSNFPAFFDGAKYLRHIGFDVVSPAEHDMEQGYNPFVMDELPDGFSVMAMLKWDLEQILHMDGIVVLPGWEDSVGTNLEIDTARRVGLPIYSYDTGKLLHQPQTIVGFAGVAQAGKDTAAAYLVNNHGYTRAAFADALKAVLYATNPLVAIGPGEIILNDSGVGMRVQDIVDSVGWEEAKGIGDIRPLLQRLGTEAGRRQIRDSVWVDTVFERNKDNDLLVISDVRFPNEVAAVHNRDGVVIQINRPGFVPVNGHISESALTEDDYDAVINNAWTIEDLHTQIEKTLGQLGINL